MGSELRRQICDDKIRQFPALTSRDVNLRLSTGKFILKAPRTIVKIVVKAWNNITIVIFRWKMEIYFISWTLDSNIFTRGKPLVKICRLMLTRWNKFRSSTENNNYPINHCFLCLSCFSVVYLRITVDYHSIISLFQAVKLSFIVRIDCFRVFPKDPSFAIRRSDWLTI